MVDTSPLCGGVLAKCEFNHYRTEDLLDRCLPSAKIPCVESLASLHQQNSELKANPQRL
jgi:hypothetical protein